MLLHQLVVIHQCIAGGKPLHVSFSVERLFILILRLIEVHRHFRVGSDPGRLGQPQRGPTGTQSVGGEFQIWPLDGFWTRRLLGRLTTDGMTLPAEFRIRQQFPGLRQIIGMFRILKQRLELLVLPVDIGRSTLGYLLIRIRDAVNSREVVGQHARVFAAHIESRHTQHGHRTNGMRVPQELVQPRCLDLVTFAIENGRNLMSRQTGDFRIDPAVLRFQMTEQPLGEVASSSALNRDEILLQHGNR